MSLYLVRENFVSFEALFKTIVFSNFSYSIYKIILMILSLMGIVDVTTLMRDTGIRIMIMSIYGGLYRIQTSLDIVAPFLLFFFLISDQLSVNFSKKFKFVFLIVTAISIFLGFSRYLIFVSLISLMMYWFTLSNLKRISLLFAFTIMVIGGVAMIGIDTVYSIIEVRFFSRSNTISDDVRSEQVRLLLQNYQDYPFFGLGLGGYTTHNIRDTINFHSYEVQWVAFLMQLGLIGILLTMIPLGIIFVKILKWPLTKVKVGCSALFLLWLISGFTNPFLISLTSGIIYSLFMLTGIRLRTSNASDSNSFPVG
jgi:hypothetical protein